MALAPLILRTTEGMRRISASDAGGAKFAAYECYGT
jgi:hypothetical protein